MIKFVVLVISILFLACSSQLVENIKPPDLQSAVTIPQHKKLRLNNFLATSSGNRELATLDRDIYTVNWNAFDFDSTSLAKAEDKLLFIYATNGNSECNQMENKTFKDKIITEFINENFVAIILDSKNDQSSMKEISINEYPMIIINSPTGQTIWTFEGYFGPNSLIYDLEKIHKAWTKNR